MTAANNTLASAASFTAILSPLCEIFQKFFFRNPLFLELTGNIGGQHSKQLTPEVHG
jgi:hypothetical protein